MRHGTRGITKPVIRAGSLHTLVSLARDTLAMQGRLWTTGPTEGPTMSDATVGPAALELRPRTRVVRQTGLSPATIHRKVRTGDFPKPVHIGRSARWVGSEVDAWITAHIAARDAQGGAL
jgi:prophage regulatory protein